MHQGELKITLSPVYIHDICLKCQVFNQTVDNCRVDDIIGMNIVREYLC